MQPNFPWTFSLVHYNSMAIEIRQVFCEAFWADAVDCGLHCRHFRANGSSVGSSRAIADADGDYASLTLAQLSMNPSLIRRAVDQWFSEADASSGAHVKCQAAEEGSCPASLNGRLGTRL